MIPAGSPSTKMDEFQNLLNTQDIKKKLSVGNDLLNYLQNDENSLECTDIGLFIDGLLPWLQNSNYKVAQYGLDIYTALVERLQSDFRPYVPTIFAHIMDRLGDNKDVVRERCKNLMIKLMEHEAISPNNLFDRLTPTFNHKNSKVREEGMNLLIATLNAYGAQSLSISRLVPYLVKLMSDPNLDVRDTAFNTVVEIYRHVGDKFKTDLQKKQQVPQNKLPHLLAKFDEMKAAGEVLNTCADTTMDEDETDRSIGRSSSKSGAVRRNVTPAASKSGQGSASAVAGSSIPTSKLIRSGSLRKPTSTPSSSGAAGAVDEEYFQKAFEDVPSVPLMSHKEIDNVMGKIRDNICIQDFWEKRVEAMKKLRAVIIAGGAQYNEVLAHIKMLDIPLETSLKDLRSQVVREACITIAFLSQQLQNKLDHFAEVVFPSLMYLIQNSAKVISSSGVVCIRFMLTNTHPPRLIPVIVQHMSSKSTPIRRAACEFMDLIVHLWKTHSLEKHIALLQDGIKKGISDPSAEARVFARKAFWGFKEHFPEQAEALLNSLDASYKRSLYGEMTGAMSNSSSSNSLHHTGHMPPTSSRATPRLNLSRHANDGVNTPRRIGTPTSTSLRSNSAIDLQAAQRAKARAQYAALARQKVGSGASLPRPKKIDSGPPSLQGSITSQHSAAERVGRTRSRVSGVSQSQPSSRSGSPSSRLNYATYNNYGSNVETPMSFSMSRTRRSIPRSTGTSRETSPNRFSTLHNFGSKLRSRPGDRPPIHTTRPPVMAHKMLQQSIEAESALADALGSFEPSEGFDIGHRMSPRKSSYRLCEDHSDDSETSSVCSERSFDSFRRQSDSYSWSGSQQRLYRDMWEPMNKDIGEIIANCESTHWSDRKEGLVGLQLYLQAGSTLAPADLKRVTDNFTKMFMDSHTKVFSLFLDTLNELIISHRADLNPWLYVLLTRLLNKLGADLLGSIQTKIHKSLDVVRESFPCELQMSSVLRFLVDATQTPNARVKTAALNYITKLAPMTDQGLAFPPSTPGQAKDTATAALTKMIGWTMGDSIKQGGELRRAAQEAILALFNLNTPQVTLRFAQLPKEYQEAALSLINGRVRRSSSGGGTDTNSPPSPSPASPRLNSPAPQRQRYSPGVLPHCDTENLNPEEVYKSLRRTTAEIQNYSYESGGGKLLDRDTTSQDSGISQMSAGAGERLEDRMEELSIRPNNARQSLPLASNTGRVLTVRDCNGMDTPDSGTQPNDNSFSTGDNEAHSVDESEAMRRVVESFNFPVEGEANSENCTSLSEADKKTALTQLMKLIRESSCATIMDHFKSLLRILLSQVSAGDGQCKILVLGALTEMIKKKPLTDSFNNYVELLILRVLPSYKESSKEVLRSAELCANTIATTLSPDMVIRVLAPLITTADYPINLAAVKMLTRLVETRGKDPVENYLPDLMPGLVQAYDNVEISVRKSAVFCMVALHSTVGEEALKPHLAALNGSKLKLLHLYIRRAQQGSSAPTSPKNHPPASPSS